ncbi:MAG: type II toxin-antitoxin system VapC family toxin, partial [Fimbriimonadaceae bacterium]|nr:type II toxin-antitoxin system VapC family toxin [Fimbriimonadaceae bacterium]
MIVDASAILAIARAEPESDRLIDLLKTHAGDVLISAPAYLELFIVAEQRYGLSVAETIERTIQDYRMIVVPFDRELAEVARVAYR